MINASHRFLQCDASMCACIGGNLSIGANCSVPTACNATTLLCLAERNRCRLAAITPLLNITSCYPFATSYIEDWTCVRAVCTGVEPANSCEESMVRTACILPPDTMKPPHGTLPELIRTQQIVTFTTAILGILSTDMTSTLHGNRFECIIRAFKCEGRSDYAPVEELSHPLRFTIGTEPHINMHCGRILGAVALIFLIMGIHGLLARKFGVKKVAFPSRSVPVLMFFYQPMRTSALTLAFYAQSRYMRFFGIGVNILMTAPVGLIGYKTTGKRFNSKWFLRIAGETGHEIEAAYRSGQGNLRSRCVAFIKYSDGEWKDLDGGDVYCSQYGQYFNSYRDGWQNYLLVEFFISDCMAILEFQIVVGAGAHCIALNAVLFGILLLSTCVLIFCRPLCKPVDFHLTLTSSFVQTGIALVALIQSADPSSNKDALEGLVSVFGVILTIVTTLKSIASFITKSDSVLNYLYKKLGITDRTTQRFAIDSREGPLPADGGHIEPDDDEEMLPTVVPPPNIVQIPVAVDFSVAPALPLFSQPQLSPEPDFLDRPPAPKPALFRFDEADLEVPVMPVVVPFESSGEDKDHPKAVQPIALRPKLPPRPGLPQRPTLPSPQLSPKRKWSI